jgi:lipopolysaccharide transport system ATP-binding protein
MSSDYAIRVSGLSKQYQIGVSRMRASLRERISHAALSPWRRLIGRERTAGPTKSFWALKDLDFDVRRGDVVGVIGGNGAGKSTLLKILSRISSPTEGEAVIRGRVGSLLEVGMGFHPELTGRENVYLNGAILGMRKAEIARKFDEIVSFAEVEEFIDTPVRRYSTGMYVRLAFAVAAQMDPEILIVDEVLAVGDRQFQQKCLGRLNDVAGGGRTVLFVSHNMAAIQRLCKTALLLDRGRLVRAGDVRSTVAAYLGGETRGGYLATARTGKPQILSADLRDTNGAPLGRVTTPDDVVCHISYVLPQTSPGLRIGMTLMSADGLTLFTSSTDDAGVAVPSAPGTYEARLTIPANTLLAGDFHLALAMHTAVDWIEFLEPALSFSVDPGTSPLYTEERKGYVHVPCGWAIDAGAAERRELVAR